MSDETESRIDGRSREARAARQVAQPQPSADNVPEVVEPAGEVAEGRLTRSTRRPFGAMAQKLAYPPREGFHRHWFNDNPGRVEFAVEEAGYKHVIDPRTGKNVSRVVGTREGGAPITAFLLEIPQDWFNDDMKRYEEENAARDDAIRRGQVQAKNAQDQSRFYPSAQGRDIKFQTIRR